MDFLKPTVNFPAYLSSQKRIIFMSMGISTLCFVLLKFCFPYPDFFVDSNSYVLWAFSRADVAYRPTGYSFFLRFTHSLMVSAYFTVFVQYLLSFLSMIFCFFSVDYLFGLPKKLKTVLLVLLLVNPLLLFQTNLISSDSLFCSCTVVWFTLWCWIIKTNWLWAFVLQLLLLYCCVEIRYTALFFPVTAVVTVFLFRTKWLYRIAAFVLTMSVVLFCIQRQKSLNELEVGTPAFSAFEGWQIANNALYCYKHISIDESDLPSIGSVRLDNDVRHCIDSVPDPGKVGSAYIWEKQSPLRKYQYQVGRVFEIAYFPAWCVASIAMHEYGWYIVKNFPKEFAIYYILPNTVNYFYPESEALANYNAGNMLVPPDTKEWFGLDIDYLVCRFPDMQAAIIVIMPAMSLLLNVFIIVVILLFLFRNVPKWKKTDRDTRNLFVAWSVFYFAFMGFTIFAAAVNLRFMDSIFILGPIMSFALLSPVKPIEGNR